MEKGTNDGQSTCENMTKTYVATAWSIGDSNDVHTMPSTICWMPKSRGMQAKRIVDFDFTCRRVKALAVTSMTPAVKLAVAEKHIRGK